MLTIPRRLVGSLALTALALVCLPAVAEAQLFPHWPIRRERPSCAQEPPEFRQTRQMYYGYFPTCWRKFPPGWGCPTAERVDIEGMRRDIQSEFEKMQTGAGAQPEGPLPDNTMPNTPEEGGGPPPNTVPPGEEPTPVPSREERSPFRMDDGSGRRPGNSGTPRGTPRPGTGEPVTPPATTPGSGSPGGSAGLDAPAESVSASGSDPGAPLTLLDVGNPSSPVSSGALVSGADDLPFPSPPAASSPSPVPPSAPAPPAVAVAPSPYTPAPVIQAPPRRRLIGGLFQNLNWLRR
ncbi:MAG TPA: hypothetical protein VGZ22_00375 [Isosphaeraceae bacterium]|jgi:hypothetical protein|nr:hypothetical protein [Isosphaeraceae bacterium]